MQYSEENYFCLFPHIQHISVNFNWMYHLLISSFLFPRKQINHLLQKQNSLLNDKLAVIYKKLHFLWMLCSFEHIEFDGFLFYLVLHCPLCLCSYKFGLILSQQKVFNSDYLTLNDLNSGSFSWCRLDSFYS